MDLGGIALVILIFVVGLGLAAGTLAWIMGRKDEQTQANQEEARPGGYVDGDELPPREDAWKPAVWYSEAAKGTLFPNQPSPSFRISADTAFQRAIAQRDREAMTPDGPTAPDLPAARPATSSALNQEKLDTSIPDEVENLSEIPTQTMYAVPVKDELPSTLKLRSVARGRTTYPLPAAMVEAETSAMMEEPPVPEPVAIDSAASVVDVGEEAPAFDDGLDTEVYQEVLDTPIWVEQVDTAQPIHPSFSMPMEEVDTSEMVAVQTPGWVGQSESSELVALESPLAEEQVDTSQPAAAQTPGWVEQVDTSQLEAPSPPPPVPLEDIDAFQPLAAPTPRYELEESVQQVPDIQSEPEAELLDVREEVSGPLETSEERYERLMVEAYSQVIHVGYDEELDAVGIAFSGCPIRQNSDVPWVFKTISRKIQDVLAPQPWGQHALLLDVAKLQVAAEAEAAWEMMLDGFVAQTCPEVTPYAVLAIQFDSSTSPDEKPAPGDVTQDLQLASSVTGQQRPLIQVSSYEAALVLLQLLRTEL